MKCLVTGGNGFIGSHIVDRLVDLGYETVVIDDLSAPENEEFYFNDGADYFKKNITKDDCSSYFEDVDFVFHLAARSRIQPTIDAPCQCFETNVIGTQRVLEWSRMHSIKKLMYSGTSSLYGHQNVTPFNPNMPADCLNPYSMSKWVGEQICKLYNQLYDLNTIVLRYFNVYGPREPVKGEYAPVIGLFKRQFRNGQPMTIVGDGEQRRDFTYIDDVVDSNILSMHNEGTEHKIYNIGTGRSHTINEIVGMIGGENPWTIHLAERPAEVRETLADIEGTIECLGWKPKRRLEEMIMSY